MCVALGESNGSEREPRRLLVNPARFTAGSQFVGQIDLIEASPLEPDPDPAGDKRWFDLRRPCDCFTVFIAAQRFVCAAAIFRFVTALMSNRRAEESSSPIQILVGLLR